MINPQMLEKLTSIMSMMKVPEELISQVKDSVNKGEASIEVVKVEKKPEEVKMTADQIDKMSEQEAKTELKKAMGCDEEKKPEPYKGTPEEQSMRDGMMKPIM